MKKITIYLVNLLFASLTITSCSDELENSTSSEMDGVEEDFSQYKNILSEYEEQGWTYLKTHGNVGDYIMHRFVKAETAKQITAYWRYEGELQEEVYRQNDKIYLINSFYQENGDFFSIVMEKKKK